MEKEIRFIHEIQVETNGPVVQTNHKIVKITFESGYEADDAFPPKEPKKEIISETTYVYMMLLLRVTRHIP